ncbi:putative n-acetylglucosamine-6-phosphate deacetylase protein [Zalerion maritima]|uniref:N-acetylglucosamine-6-phosphate deacetylase n=1 Tax=Zalerion maritima TaxID=339359 RepID=A0AAD5RIM9_9PEZI|nr:putative n-acetylglucosamine-6-phosphate deacetylase protein [Zalerion maritima]
MPSAVDIPRNGVTKFTNCRLLRAGSLVEGDLWVSSFTGKIIRSQEAFYDEYIVPDEVVNLGGRILAPGLIECQLNGAFGFNFSTLMGDMSQYGKELRDLNRKLIQTGVTSYVPTVTSQTRELYHKVLPFLGPSGHKQSAEDGAESLGAHIEGPFLDPARHGVHNINVFREAKTWEDLEECYGAENINPAGNSEPMPVKMITAAPELGNMTKLIPEITSRGIIYSIGHSGATYEDASAAVGAGATMITHLFNAMNPLHHRNPGIFGVLGLKESQPRPYYGVISDGIHLHPTTVKIAYNAHPDGFILVTDAMHMVGLPDGSYTWTNGGKTMNLVKRGTQLLLEGSNTLAGSTITLIECVSNFISWTGASIPEGLKAVTATPAAMLGLQGVKGTLDGDADADLVVLSAEKDGAAVKLVVDEVWKFGARVFKSNT